MPTPAPRGARPLWMIGFAWRAMRLAGCVLAGLALAGKAGAQGLVSPATTVGSGSVDIAPGAGAIVTFPGPITDADFAAIGAAPGARLVIHAGTTVFGGANTYTAPTVLLDGTLRATNGVGLPVGSNLVLAGPDRLGGGVLESSGVFSRPLGSGAGQVRWTGSGGFAAQGGALTVTLGSGGGLTWGRNGFVPAGSALVFGSATATDRVTFTNAFNTNGNTAYVMVASNGNPAADAVLGGVISGSGGLSVGGNGFDGVLTLAAANTYTGATAIAAGATVLLGSAGGFDRTRLLAVDGRLDISATTGGATAGALQGSGAIVLGARTLTLVKAEGLDFAGTISGSGGLTLAGGTAQTLSGVNTYTGTTTIGTGVRLAVNDLNGIAASAGVVADGTLDISGTPDALNITSLSGAGRVMLGTSTLTVTHASGTFAGTIVDDGHLAITGGTLGLTGASSFTGGTTVSNATLVINADAALGDAAGPLDLVGGRLLTSADVTTGRTITLFPGSTIDSGAFNFSTSGPIILVDVDDNYTLAFTGTARVVGPLNLTSTRLTVTAAGVLTGAGAVNVGTVVTGALQPGDGIGTLTFNAPLGLTPSATTRVNLDGPGRFSQMVARGEGNTITLGGLLQPVLRGIGGGAGNAYVAHVTDRFVVMTAEAGVVGGFAGLVQPAEGLEAGARFDALTTAQAVTLYVTPADYRDLSAWNTRLTPGQAQVAAGINALRGTAGVRGDAAVTDALGRLFQIQPAALPAVFDTLSGAIYGSAMTARLDRGRRFGGTIEDRLAARRGGMDTPEIDLDPQGEGVVMWLASPGQSLRVGGRGGTAMRADGAGFVLGADWMVDDDNLAGLAVGSSAGQVAVPGGAASAALTTTALAGYASWSDGRWFLDAQVALSRADGAVRRDLPIASARARGQVAGWGGGGGLTVGLNLQGRETDWNVAPEFGMRLDQAQRDALRESGGGGFGLRVASTAATSARSSLGARAGSVMDLGEDFALSINGRLAWVHEFADTGAVTGASFASGLPTVAMTSRSGRVGREGVAAGFGLDLKFPGGPNLYASYAGDFRGNAAGQSATAGLRVDW